MFSMPVAAPFTGMSLFFLRLMAALVFGTGGFYHLEAPRQRA